MPPAACCLLPAQLESEAYSLWMAGSVLLEKESDWEGAAARFLRARCAAAAGALPALLLVLLLLLLALLLLVLLLAADGSSSGQCGARMCEGVASVPGGGASIVARHAI